jgi:transcriptional regulator of arginine metabolism
MRGMPHKLQADRLDADLRQLLEREAIGEQAELLDRLTALGHMLTQPTLSRQLKRLGYAKRDGAWQPPEQAESLPVRRLAVAPPNLLVLKTDPGFANALAARLDAAPLPGQVGTLAGDDTVFLAVLPEDLESAVLRLRRRFAIAAG